MTPPIFGAIKYVLSLITSVLAFYYKVGESTIMGTWLMFAIISTIYSYIWDIKIDWELLKKNNLHPLLREKLIFGSPKIYYSIMVANFFMMIIWILTLSP